MAGRDRCRVAILGDGPLADEARAAIEAAGLPVGDADDATVTVLADGLHPDVPARFDHACLDRPHLPLATLGERAVAGPIVVPGRTGCLRCAHLHRRDGDPAWPLLSVQWSQALRGDGEPAGRSAAHAPGRSTGSTAGPRVGGRARRSRLAGAGSRGS